AFERIRPHADVSAILAASTLAFYAFIGFEDLANLSEEALDPQRDIPLAILTAVCVCGALYMVIVCIVLVTLGADTAALTSTPLLDVIRRAEIAIPLRLFSLIAILSVTNTGLANLIMASRLLYGMSNDGLVPKELSLVHVRRKTPWVAVIVAMLLCCLLVVTGGVKVMAQTTSLLLVCVFALTHVSLLRLRRRQAQAARFCVPAVVPYIGLSFCALLLLRFPSDAYFRMGMVLAAGTLTYMFCAAGPLASRRLS
ncbi:MAG: APC family permease, partial [Elusimicrobiota bacterium]